jgi:hypothetical protein
MGWASQTEIRTRVTDDDVSGFRATIGPERNIGMIAFLYDGRAHRFGIGLAEKEALRLIATIRERFKIADDRWEPLPVGP